MSEYARRHKVIKELHKLIDAHGLADADSCGVIDSNTVDEVIHVTFPDGSGFYIGCVEIEEPS